MKFDLKTAYATYKECYLITEHKNSARAVDIYIWNDEDGPIVGLTRMIPARENPKIDAAYGKNAAFVDTNNLPEAMQLIQQLNLGTFTGVQERNGFCEYPLVLFNMEEVGKYTE